jgi:NADH-quinone oxidoreductase subunit M
MLWLYQRVFFGQITKPENENLKDLDTREAWQFAPLIFLIFWIGIYPKPLLSYINPQTEAVVAQVRPNYFQNAPAAQKNEVAKENADSEMQKTESTQNQ